MKLLQSRYVPLFLTLARLILSPLVLAPLLVFSGSSNLAFLWAVSLTTFFVLCVTDFVDGYIARKHNTICQSGTILDPIADKFLVISTSVALLAVQEIAWYWVIVFLCRDAFVTSLRLWGAQVGLALPVFFLSKVKTIAVMLSLGLVILHKTTALTFDRNFPFLTDVTFAVLLTAAILSVVTAMLYVQRAYALFTLSR